MVRVGILHSLTGSMAISEVSLRDAALLAIAEINAQGGVLGEPIEPIVVDGASDPATFVAGAERLLARSAIATLFGCWTSASRKAVRPVVEAHNCLLWYPVQYEGLEQSPNIFYTGSCINQQVEPAVNWLVLQGHRRFYLLGSDYIFPWTANKLIRAQLQKLGGAVLGERYVSLGQTDFAAEMAEIQQLQPDVVFNTINGDSNLAFYRQYQAAGLTAERIPIMAVSVAEAELQSIGAAATTGHYASWSYFQSLATPANQQFVANFQRRYGPDRVTSDPIEAAYYQVYLWWQAVTTAGDLDSDRVRQAAYGQSFHGPGGLVTLEANHHVRKPCRIGQIRADGQFDILFESDGPIAPLPWLGVENTAFANAPVVMQLLADVSQWIQKAQDLEVALTQLRQEMADRQRAETALITSRTQLARAQAELEITHRLQKMLLPTEEELRHLVGLDIAGFMEPAEKVGGDYYDVMVLGDRVRIGIGDVTGHGLESSLVMLMAHTAIRTLIANGETCSANLLNTVNRLLYENIRRMKSHKNMTLALLEYQGGVLRLSGQHEELLVIRQNGTLEKFDTLELGFPLGLALDISEFVAEVEVQLHPDDVAVLYTDGIPEAPNAEHELYGLERFCRVLQANRQRSARDIREAAIADLRQYIGQQQVYDDITLLILKQQ